MTLVVKQQDPPVPKSIEGDLLEKLVTVMSALYNTDMMVLDLSAFHKNEGKLNYQLYCMRCNSPLVVYWLSFISSFEIR